MAGLNNIDAYVEVPNVDGWLNILNDYADSAIDNAYNVASSLNGFVPTEYSPSVQFEGINTDVNLTSSTKPSRPVVNTTSKSLPSAIGITAPSISLEEAPVFTGTDPSLNIPDVPDPLSINLPVKDFIVDTSLDFPVSPDTTLPSVPSLLSLDLPEPASIALPIFALDFPTSNSLVPPGLTFSFMEELYSSPLLDKVKTELLRRLDGGTGLSTIVEQAIWDRGKDRESKALTLAERSLLVDRSSQGFSRPTGAALAALEGVVQESQSKIIELSREVMIKQAELEQTNLKDAIQQTIVLEDILIKDNLTRNQRSFEVAKYFQDVAVELFKVQVSKYNSEVEAYKAFAVAYQARVQAELSKVEIFKAEIDAQKLKGDINEQNIRIYVAQLEGIKTNVEVYKALISAVSEKLKAETLKIEVYKTDVDAYRSAVSAKAEEYSMYSEQIKGELSKVQVFDSKVKAYTSRIQGYAAKADVLTKKAEVEKDIEGLKIKKYEADIDAYIKSVQADQLLYQTAVDIYRGETQMYLADVSTNRAVAELELKQADNIIQQNKFTSDIAIQNAQISLESIKAAYLSLLESKKSAGSIYSQIGSSALSAINVSASLAGSVSVQAQESHNYTDQ